MSLLQVSVIICSHNPRPVFLERTMQALRQQTLPSAEWELLLVDNRSDAPLARSVDLTWHPGARHLREEKLGLTAARLRGIKEAGGKLLVFVDDDNILAADYLEEACGIAENYPWLGVWGGENIPEFEASPPEWSKPYWRYLALRNVERDCWTNIISFEHAPCGAGMCVRRDLANTYAVRVSSDPLRQTLGRNGAALCGGEDSDLAFIACESGMGMGLFGRLRLTHIIPKSRLEAEYLARLLEGSAYSAVLVMFLHGRIPEEAKRSRVRRVFDAYLRFRMTSREAHLSAAQERGTRAALQELIIRGLVTS